MTWLSLLTSLEAQLAGRTPRSRIKERVLSAHTVSTPREARIQELNPGIDLRTTQEQFGLWESAVAPAWGRSGWPGRLRSKSRDPDPPLARPTRTYLAAAAPVERRALRPGTAGAEAGCRSTRRGLQLAPPTLPAHPGAEAAPAESRHCRPLQPAVTKPRIIPGAPPRVRMPHTRHGRDGSLLAQPCPPQLRPPPTGRGRELKDTLTPPRPDKHPPLQPQLPKSRFRASFLRPLALRLEKK